MGVGSEGGSLASGVGATEVWVGGGGTVVPSGTVPVGTLQPTRLNRTAKISKDDEREILKRIPDSIEILTAQ
jgi:hypothetical protein